MTPRIARFFFPWRPRRPYLAGTGHRRITTTPRNEPRRVRPESQSDPQPGRTDFTDASVLPHPQGGVHGHALVVRSIGEAPKSEPPWVPPRWTAPTVTMAVLDPGLWYPAVSASDATPAKLYADGTDLPLPPSQQPRHPQQSEPVVIRAEHYPEPDSPCLRHILESYSVHEQVLELERQARRATAAVRPLFDTGESLLQMRAAMASEEQEDQDRERDLRMAALGRYQKVTPRRPRRPGSLDTGVFPTVEESRFDAAPSGWETTR